MRFILLSLFVFIVCFTGSGQTEKKIEIPVLVKIAETSDFPGLVKLVKSLSYQVSDSSTQSDGSLIYISRESEINGNILGCFVDAKHKINQVSFSTYSKEIYNDLKQQAKNSGFRSSGLRKRHENGISETEDLEKGKTLISIAAKNKENGHTEYEFTILQW
ncbi:MAG: hypothetical protein Q8941_04640 [Bacteroidota bacterium]|nr:hypothetical protein [Bacteroidota bacterium]